MYLVVFIVFWMDYVNEFVVGIRVMVLIFFKDVFGNNVVLINIEFNSYFFNVFEFYVNDFVVNVFSVIFLGWNDYGYFRIEFIVFLVGDFLLYV